MIKTIDFTGRQFGYLEYLREGDFIAKKKGRTRHVICRCICGKTLSVAASALTKTKSPQKSCGCMQLRPKIHGLSAHPLFGVYADIKQRCYNENNVSYINYGAKGIIMCDEWKSSFMAFYNWCINNGWQPGFQIDKDAKSSIKPGSIYSPELCSILTHKENCNNRSDSDYYLYNGKSLTLTQIAEHIGIRSKTLYKRIHYQNMTFEEAICVQDGRKNALGARKLSNEEVIKIFHSTGAAKLLSIMYKVDQSVIYNIRNKRKWKHLLEKL